MARKFINLSWWALDQLPIRMSWVILRATLGRAYFSKVRERGRMHLAARLVVDGILRKQPKVVATKKVILIGGVPRIGKTTIANLVAHKTGGRVVSVDRLKRYYQSCSVGRIELKHWIIDELCRRGNGLIIEGDELITDEKINLSINQTDFSVTAAIIKDKVERWGAYGFVVGAAADSPKEKKKGLYHSAEDNDCWAVSALSSSELRTLSVLLSSHSKALRAESNHLHIPYFEIRSERFDDSVRHAANQIARTAMRGNRFGS